MTEQVVFSIIFHIFAKRNCKWVFKISHIMKKFTKENDLLIIPDVHGRKFWREAVDNKPHSHVIFLGDYVDPYTREGIYPENAWEEFDKIIDYADSHAQTTTMLLGNHDMHYSSDLFDEIAEGSRYSNSTKRKVRPIFDSHSYLFSLAFEAEYEGIHCLFTHAGISPYWLLEHEDIVGEPTAENINNLYYTREGMEALAEVGWARGGWVKAGGPMWADYSEVAVTETLPGIYQIFGHTQTADSKPIINRYMACLDCHKAFLLSEVMEKAFR